MKTKTLLVAVALFLTVGLASAQQKDSTCCKAEKVKTCACVCKDGNATCKKDDKGACNSEKCKCAKECTKKDAKATCAKDSTATCAKDAKKCDKKK